MLVASRRSTLRLADRVVVMDSGRLVASGTPAKLQQHCDLYRRLLGVATTEANDGQG